MKIRYTAFIVLAGLLLSVTSVYAVDFYGASVTDSDVPSSYLKVGLFGFRPIVGTVVFDSPAARHGFRLGDIIISINGREIRKSSELNQFTTDLLSVSIFRSKEKMTVTIDRRPIETVQTKPVAPNKQSATQRQIKHDITVAAVKTPPVKLENRAAELPAPVPREVPQTRIKQAQAKREIAEVLSKTDSTGISGKSGPSPAATMPSHAVPVKGDIFTRKIKPAQDQIVFDNNRGEVVFSHSSHSRSLNKEQCMLCHQIENPTPESIRNRLDNYRAAHGFCRGCHQKAGKELPTECQACHNHNKKT